MKAAQIDGFGGPEKIIVRDLEAPRAGAAELVVFIKASSVNPADEKVRSGDPHYVRYHDLPLTLGRDMSGVVVEVGDNVSQFRVGDEVFAVTTRGMEGCYAEYIAIPAVLCAKKPPEIRHEDMAAMALTGLTALTALKAGDIRSGERVLIHGAGGAVGGIAVQYARHLGGQVFATARSQDERYVLEVGADKVIAFDKCDFATLSFKYDVVLDALGGETRRRSTQVLKANGRLICVGGNITGLQQLRPDIQVIRPVIQRGGHHLDVLAVLARNGTVGPPRHELLPLDAAAIAHWRLMTPGSQRKMVLCPI